MGAGLVHVLIVFTLLCFVIAMLCAYADGLVDEWLDRFAAWREDVAFRMRNRV